MRSVVPVLVLSLTLVLFVAVPVCAVGLLEPLVLPEDRVLRISKEQIEFEHHGILPLSDQIECYQHWEEESYAVPLAGVLVGFKEVVATFDGKQITRLDVYDPLYIRTMLVAITTDQFRSIEHEHLSLSPTSKLYVEEKGTGRGFVVRQGETIEVFAENQQIRMLDPAGRLWEFGSRVYLWPDLQGLIQLNSLQRGTSSKFKPQYRGRFELATVAENRFLTINEVDLEEYLYQVVPSEMPLSWPAEALKAQAVAARTYAVAQVIYSRQGHLGFHVSDSTSSQVYNNQPEAASTTAAINATAGQILAQADGTISSTYFYSTSARGILSDASSWKQNSELALEGNSPWYRWQCSLTGAELTNLLQSVLGSDLGTVTGLKIIERDSYGRVTTLGVQGSKKEASISGELNIRTALKPASLKRAGDTLTNLSLLPSAFFYFETKNTAQGALQEITFYGGGSGHGLGMSQWGAKGMAEAGLDYLDILAKYYPAAHLITYSEQLRY